MAKKQPVRVSYEQGSRVRAVVVHLLEVTGKGEGRNGKSSDYKFARQTAEFGNLNGFIPAWRLSLLGKIYNRVNRELGSRATSWRNI